MSGSNTGLGTGLKQRHVTMMSIAGVIGAGLFVGSGHAIAAAGPAVLLAYAAAGMLVVLVGMTFGAYRRLRRGNLVSYLVTAASVPALILYLAVANAGAIVGAMLGKKTDFVRTPKTGT